MKFVYTIEPTGFALRKGCEGSTLIREDDKLNITVVVKPGGRNLTVIDRINPLESGLKVKKLEC